MLKIVKETVTQNKCTKNNYRDIIMSSRGEKFRKAIRAILFCCGTILLLIVSSNVLKEKWYKNDLYYDLNNDSVDYLTLGMSHVYYGINPVYIYTHSGYVGYNLGDEAQNIQFSCFWLEEALKSQSPKVVFYDVGSLFYLESSMAEGWKLKEYAAMPFSKNKITAVLEGTNNKSTQIGALLPILYFHGEWKNLMKEDFKRSSLYNMGAAIRYDTFGAENPIPVNPYRIEHNGEENYTTDNIISSTNQEYFERILSLCRSNNILLVPIKIPTNNWDDGRAAQARDFLYDYELTLFDLNQEEDLVNWGTDTFDKGYHLNYWGACKVSERLCAYLEDQFGNREKESEDSFLSEVLCNYRKDNQAFLLTGADRREKFFRWLAENKDRYNIIITVQDHLSGSVDDIDRYLRRMGLSGYNEQEINHSYIAVLREGEVMYEEWSPLKLEYRSAGLFGLKDSSVRVKSSGKLSHLITDSVDLGAVYLEDHNFSLNKQGLNIVVFDPASGVALSRSVHFNDYDWIVLSSEEKVNYLESDVSESGDPFVVKTTESDQIQQEIVLQNCGDGIYYVQNQEGDFLTVEHAGTESGTGVCWERLTGDADQCWLLFQGNKQGYYLRSLYNHLVLRKTPDGSLILGNSGENKIFRLLKNN